MRALALGFLPVFVIFAMIAYFKSNVCKLKVIYLFRKRTISSLLISKDFDGPFPNKYNPKAVESGWYEWWIQKDLFVPISQLLTATNDAECRKTFSMILPPPNVTGDLHLGHALTVAIQDSIARWRRAKGDNVVWIPGFDHAGIATQVVIEKKLKAESGRLRHQISRQEFISITNEWKNKKVATIEKQLKSLGASLDWNRLCFTMDEKFEESVVEAFIRLYDEGLIERQKRLVNWCCHLQSSISDIEVETLHVSGGEKYRVPGCNTLVDVGRFIYFAYPIFNSATNEEIVVATTRPETIFGDVAVAVHPRDGRYSHLIGQTALHPFDRRQVPIISDDSVLPEFGSGCVKITPAHDYSDFEVATRHRLPFISVFDDNGFLTVNVEPFKGLTRFEARNVVIDKLQQIGLLRDQQNISTTIPICGRTGDIIEPMLKDQWYMNCTEMFTRLTNAIESNEMCIQPEPSKAMLLNWLKEKRNWCISRQLWWGHQIPAYKVKRSMNGEEVMVVGRTAEEAASRASSLLQRPIKVEDLDRDEDVLDTWFSSSLFPFASLGWPNKKDPQFDDFYPLSLLETGHDIIFFWVARMAVLGHKLTGKNPFTNVLTHGLICDAHGRKMSKSLGNVIDPEDILRGISLKSLRDKSEQFFKEGYINEEELKTACKSLNKDYPNGIEECGADALRFALLTHDITSQFINLNVSYVESCKPFCNKIWQASKFFLLHLQKANVELETLNQVELGSSILDAWILHHLSETVKECEENFNSYNLHLVTQAIRQFWVTRLCDVYLEGIKPVLSDKNTDRKSKIGCLRTLKSCIEVGVVLFAPIMPFLAEELYHRLKLGSYSSVSLHPYPSPLHWNEWCNPELNLAFDEILQVASLLRRLKVKYCIAHLKPRVVLFSKRVEIFSKCQLQVETLAGCQLLAISDDKPHLQKGYLERKINDNLLIHVNLLELINVTECMQKFKKEQLELEKKLHQVEMQVAMRDSISQPKYNLSLEKMKALRKELTEVEECVLELTK